MSFDGLASPLRMLPSRSTTRRLSWSHSAKPTPDGLITTSLRPATRMLMLPPVPVCSLPAAARRAMPISSLVAATATLSLV